LGGLLHNNVARKYKDKAMNDNLPNTEKRVGAEIDNITDIEELEEKIKGGEALLIQAESKRTGGWLPLIISLGIVIYMAMKIPRYGFIYVLFTGLGLLYLGFNIWRLFSADKQKKKTESELKEYRDRKAKLQASLTVKE
jgi:hypothetical protein